MKQSIEERFQQFHQENPHIYVELQRRAQLLLDASGRIGIKAIFESMRFDSAVQTLSDDGYKLPNDFTSRYARLLVAEHPEYEDVIELRQLRAA